MDRSYKKHTYQYVPHYPRKGKGKGRVWERDSPLMQPCICLGERATGI